MRDDRAVRGLNAGEDGGLAGADGGAVMEKSGDSGRVRRGGDVASGRNSRAKRSAVGDDWDEVGLNVGWKCGEPGWGLAGTELGGNLAGDGGGVGDSLLDQRGWEGSLEDGEDGNEVLRR